MMNEDKEWEMWKALIIKGAMLLGLAIAGMWTYGNFVQPYMHVWQQRMLGEAELARADSNRQIATCEANAKKESAKALADAEVIRAEGVAKANKIIGDSLDGNEGYLRYLYINHLAEQNDKTVIYVPTEAGLPILESSRLK
jgi:regulator of protease activity HflC (stomatin/prohibitin superfamily)